MADLGSDPERERRAADRSCGECSLCCTVLRVDELAKPAGRDCLHQRRPAEPAAARAQGLLGCAIHATRPAICRAYRCLWLQGGLEDDERPERIGAVVDLETTGVGLRLGIREARPGAYDRSPALQAIAARYRDAMPVRITDCFDPNDPDRPFRVLLPGGVEQRVLGDRVEILRDGRLVESHRLPWIDRLARAFGNAWQAAASGLRRRVASTSGTGHAPPASSSAPDEGNPIP